MKLKPLADRVIVQQPAAEEKTKSGILLPDSAKEKPTTGKVIAVGPGKLDENGKVMALSVKTGDTVTFAIGPELYSATLDADTVRLSGTSFRGEVMLNRGGLAPLRGAEPDSIDQWSIRP